MHPSRPSLLGFPGEHGRVPRRILSPPMLLVLTALCADSQTRCPLEVSQPCGLKNGLLCCRPLRARQSLVQLTSLGQAVTWSTVTRVALAEPTVSGGLRDFTRRLHLSCVDG